MKINSGQYLKHGKQDNIIVKYYLHSQVKETNQTFTREDSIVFNKHDLIKLVSNKSCCDLKFSISFNQFLDEDVINIDKPVLVGVKITNTLSRPIHDGRLHIDGFGISEIARIK